MSQAHAGTDMVMQTKSTLSTQVLASKKKTRTKTAWPLKVEGLDEKPWIQKRRGPDQDDQFIGSTETPPTRGRQWTPGVRSIVFTADALQMDAFLVLAVGVVGIKSFFPGAFTTVLPAISHLTPKLGGLCHISIQPSFSLSIDYPPGFCSLFIVCFSLCTSCRARPLLIHSPNSLVLFVSFLSTLRVQVTRALDISVHALSGALATP